MGGRRDMRERFLRHLEPLQGALEAFCRRSLRDRNAVADVLQSAVVAALRDFHLYAEGSNFRAWIFRYVHFEILNWNRRYRRDLHEILPQDLTADEAWQRALDEPLHESLLTDPMAVLDRCDDDLAGALWELPTTERSVFLLRAIGDFKYREIAEIVEVPLGTVMSTLARTRARLRQRLAEYGEQQGLLQRQQPRSKPEVNRSDQRET